MFFSDDGELSRHPDPESQHADAGAPLRIYRWKQTQSLETSSNGELGKAMLFNGTNIYYGAYLLNNDARFA